MSAAARTGLLRRPLLLLALAAALASALGAPGCGLILDLDPPDTVPAPPTLPPELDAGGCFAAYGADDGVIRFTAAGGGMASGGGRGLFTAPLVRWTFAEIGRTASTVELRITVSATETHDLRAEVLPGGGLRLTGLPGTAGSRTLAPCVDTIGLYDTTARTFSLWNAHLDDPPERAFVLDSGSSAAPRPIAGDWDGDGVDTPGLWDPATRTFTIAGAGDPGPTQSRTLDPALFPPGTFTGGLWPFAGDWDGDGRDDVGLFDEDDGTTFLIEAPPSAAAPRMYRVTGVGFGVGNVLPVAGDWAGDGRDTLAIYDRAARRFAFWNEHRPGDPDFACSGSDMVARRSPFAGDWDGDGVSSVALYDPLTGDAAMPATREVRLYAATATCPVEASFAIGPAPPADQAVWPVAGDWDGS